MQVRMLLVILAAALFAANVGAQNGAATRLTNPVAGFPRQFADLQIFDPATGTWSEGPRLPLWPGWSIGAWINEKFNY